MKNATYTVRHFDGETLFYSGEFNNFADAHEKCSELIKFANIGDYVTVTEFTGEEVIYETSYDILDGEVVEYYHDQVVCYWSWEEWDK